MPAAKISGQLRWAKWILVPDLRKKTIPLVPGVCVADLIVDTGSLIRPIEKRIFALAERHVDGHHRGVCNPATALSTRVGRLFTFLEREGGGTAQPWRTGHRTPAYRGRNLRT